MARELQGVRTGKHPGFVEPMLASLQPKPPGLAHARVLISSGTHDPIVPIENAERLAAMLREAGANVILRFEAAGHAHAPGDLAAAKEWLRE